MTIDNIESMMSDGNSKIKNDMIRNSTRRNRTIRDDMRRNSTITSNREVGGTIILPMVPMVVYIQIVAGTAKKMSVVSVATARRLQLLVGIVAHSVTTPYFV